MKSFHYFYLSLIGLLLPNVVLAHTASTQSAGFISGLSHPVLGFDHLLAMISVGILSSQIGGRAIWSIPATFVGVMLIGGILGINGIGLFSVELGIALSVVVLGTALVIYKTLPVTLCLVCVGFFALFHGHAHGTEMPTLAKPELYALGFVAGTTAIHLTGMLIGYSSKLSDLGGRLMRYAGAGIAGVGVYLVVM